MAACTQQRNVLRIDEGIHIIEIIIFMDHTGIFVTKNIRIDIIHNLHRINMILTTTGRNNYVIGLNSLVAFLRLYNLL